MPNDLLLVSFMPMETVFLNFVCRYFGGQMNMVLGGGGGVPQSDLRSTMIISRYNNDLIFFL